MYKLVPDRSVEAVTEFRYLGSVQSSSGRCYPDIHRRIGVASSAMHAMQRCWRQQRLSLDTKLRLFQSGVLQILLYGADTWTLLANDIRRLQSFHMGCQRQILGVRWQDHVTNVDIADVTGLPNITDSWQETSCTVRARSQTGYRRTYTPSLEASQLQWKLAAAQVWTGEDFLVVFERHGYSRLATEQQPAGNRCDRVQRSVDIVGSLRNLPRWWRWCPQTAALLETALLVFSSCGSFLSPSSLNALVSCYPSPYICYRHIAKSGITRNA